jgi:dicarboxylate transporter 10
MSTIASPAAKNAALSPKPQKSKSPAVHYPFWFGGSAASMAAVVTHPLDLGTRSY